MISLSVKVKPGSFKDEIAMGEEGILIIKIKEKPVDGKANSYLVKFLAKVFNISKIKVAIEKGTTSPYKKILLDIDLSHYESTLDKYKK